MQRGHALSLSKGFGTVYILVGILILGLVAGGAYYLGKSNSTPQFFSPPPSLIQPKPADKTSSPDQTANWKTYTDKTFRFKFKYPSGWNITKEEINNPKLTVRFEILGSIYTFEVVNNNNIDTRDLYWSNKKTIDGVTWNIANKIVEYECANKKCKDIQAVYYTDQGELRYSFYAPNDTPDLMNQILSTFKFTSP